MISNGYQNSTGSQIHKNQEYFKVFSTSDGTVYKFYTGHKCHIQSNVYADLTFPYNEGERRQVPVVVSQQLTKNISVQQFLQNLHQLGNIDKFLQYYPNENKVAVGDFRLLGGGNCKSKTKLIFSSFRLSKDDDSQLQKQQQKQYETIYELEISETDLVEGQERFINSVRDNGMKLLRNSGNICDFQQQQFVLQANKWYMNNQSRFFQNIAVTDLSESAKVEKYQDGIQKYSEGLVFVLQSLDKQVATTVGKRGVLATQLTAETARLLTEAIVSSQCKFFLQQNKQDASLVNLPINPQLQQFKPIQQTFLNIQTVQTIKTLCKKIVSALPDSAAQHQNLPGLMFEIQMLDIGVAKLVEINSKEGFALAVQGLLGLLKSAITLHIDQQLIETLNLGIAYAGKRFIQDYQDNLLKNVYYIESVKWRILSGKFKIKKHQKAKEEKAIDLLHSNSLIMTYESHTNEQQIQKTVQNDQLQKVHSNPSSAINVLHQKVKEKLESERELKLVLVNIQKSIVESSQRWQIKHSFVQAIYELAKHRSLISKDQLLNTIKQSALLVKIQPSIDQLWSRLQQLKWLEQSQENMSQGYLSYFFEGPTAILQQSPEGAEDDLRLVLQTLQLFSDEFRLFLINGDDDLDFKGLKQYAEEGRSTFTERVQSLLSLQIFENFISDPIKCVVDMVLSTTQNEAIFYVNNVYSFFRLFEQQFEHSILHFNEAQFRAYCADIIAAEEEEKAQALLFDFSTYAAKFRDSVANSLANLTPLKSYQNYTKKLTRILKDSLYVYVAKISDFIKKCSDDVNPQRFLIQIRHLIQHKVLQMIAKIHTEFQQISQQIHQLINDREASKPITSSELQSFQDYVAQCTEFFFRHKTLIQSDLYILERMISDFKESFHRMVAVMNFNEQQAQQIQVQQHQESENDYCETLQFTDNNQSEPKQSQDQQQKPKSKSKSKKKSHSQQSQDQQEKLQQEDDLNSQILKKNKLIASLSIRTNNKSIDGEKGSSNNGLAEPPQYEYMQKQNNGLPQSPCSSLRGPALYAHIDSQIQVIESGIEAVNENLDQIEEMLNKKRESCQKLLQAQQATMESFVFEMINEPGSLLDKAVGKLENEFLALLDDTSRDVQTLNQMLPKQQSCIEEIFQEAKKEIGAIQVQLSIFQTKLDYYVKALQAISQNQKTTTLIEFLKGVQDVAQEILALIASAQKSTSPQQRAELLQQVSDCVGRVASEIQKYSSLGIKRALYLVSLLKNSVDLFQSEVVQNIYMLKTKQKAVVSLIQSGQQSASGQFDAISLNYEDFRKQMKEHAGIIIDSLGKEFLTFKSEVADVFGKEAVQFLGSSFEVLNFALGDLAKNIGFEYLKDSLGQNAWRIRSKAALSLILLERDYKAYGGGNLASNTQMTSGSSSSPGSLNSSPSQLSKAQQIVDSIQTQLLMIKVMETSVQVQRTINDVEFVKNMNEILSNNWQRLERKIQDGMTSKIKELDKLYKQIQEEQDPLAAGEQLKSFEQKQQELDNQLDNIETVGVTLGIQIYFLKEIRKQLIRIEEKVDKIQSKLSSMEQDLLYLRGKTIEQLLQMRKGLIKQRYDKESIQSVYIPLKAKLVSLEGQEIPGTKQIIMQDYTSANSITTQRNFDSIVGQVERFLIDDTKNTLLLHGIAGSGKSTVARRIEQFLWLCFDNPEIIRKIVTKNAEQQQQQIAQQQCFLAMLAQRGGKDLGSQDLRSEMHSPLAFFQQSTQLQLQMQQHMNLQVQQQLQNAVATISATQRLSKIMTPQQSLLPPQSNTLAVQQQPQQIRYSVSNGQFPMQQQLTSLQQQQLSTHAQQQQQLQQCPANYSSCRLLELLTTKDNKKIIPIFVQLPSLQNPTKDAVEETLKSERYNFDQKQIKELLEKVQNGELLLVLILDSYDEMKQEFKGKNLYDSNNLQKWRDRADKSALFPKVITTCRSEHLNQSQYYQYFTAEIPNEKHYRPQDYYVECKLCLHDEQIQDYLAQASIHNVKMELFNLFQLLQPDDSQTIKKFQDFWNKVDAKHPFEGVASTSITVSQANNNNNRQLLIPSQQQQQQQIQGTVGGTIGVGSIASIHANLSGTPSFGPLPAGTAQQHSQFFQQQQQQQQIQSTDNEDYIITDQAIQMIFEELENQLSSRLKPEIQRTVKKKLKEFWSKKKYISTILDAGLAHLIETPFILEIVVNVLPLMFNSFSDPQKKKQRLLSQLGAEQGEIVLQILCDPDTDMFKYNTRRDVEKALKEKFIFYQRFDESVNNQIKLYLKDKLLSPSTSISCQRGGSGGNFANSSANQDTPIHKQQRKKEKGTGSNKSLLLTLPNTSSPAQQFAGVDKHQQQHSSSSSSLQMQQHHNSNNKCSAGTITSQQSSSQTQFFVLKPEKDLLCWLEEFYGQKKSVKLKNSFMEDFQRIVSLSQASHPASTTASNIAITPSTKGNQPQSTLESCLSQKHSKKHLLLEMPAKQHPHHHFMLGQQQQQQQEQLDSPELPAILPFTLTKQELVDQFISHVQVQLNLENKSLIAQCVDILFNARFSPYDFYQAFLCTYNENQINKIKDLGVGGVDFISLAEDVRKFQTKLAIKMNNMELTQVLYKSEGKLFRERSEWDLFFGKDDEFKQYIRSCVPIKVVGSVHSFNHKSLQEFLVAQHFFNSIKALDFQDLPHIINIIQKAKEDIIISSDIPVTNTVVNARHSNQLMQLSQGALAASSHNLVSPDFKLNPHSNKAYAHRRSMKLIQMKSEVTNDVAPTQNNDNCPQLTGQCSIQLQQQQQSNPDDQEIQKTEDLIFNILNENNCKTNDNTQTLNEPQSQDVHDILISQAASPKDIAQMKLELQQSLHEQYQQLKNEMFEKMKSMRQEILHDMQHTLYIRDNGGQSSVGSQGNSAMGNNKRQVHIQPHGEGRRSRGTGGVGGGNGNLSQLGGHQDLRLCEEHLKKIVEDWIKLHPKQCYVQNYINCQRFIEQIGQVKHLFAEQIKNIKIINFNIGILKFLSNKLAQDHKFRHNLLAVVRLSYLAHFDRSLEEIAASAISVLNFARVPFSGLDFSNISIPGARLSHALMHRTLLASAVLNQANMAGAVLDDAEYPDIYARDVQFSLFKELSPGHQRAVFSISYSYDGRYLASASEDGSIKIWDSASGKELKAFARAHTTQFQDINQNQDTIGDIPEQEEIGCVRCICYSPNISTYFASGGSDCLVKLWNQSEGECVACLFGHTAPVLTVCFDPSGDLLASGGFDRTVILWDLATQTQIAKLANEHDGAIYCVTFSLDGTCLATSSSDTTIRLYSFSVQQGVNRCRNNHEDEENYKGQIHNQKYPKTMDNLDKGEYQDDQQSVEACQATVQFIKQLQGHSDIVYSICFSPDGLFLASGSRDKSIKVWDLQQEKKLKQISMQSDVVYSVCYSPDGRYLASSCQDKIIKVWDVFQGVEVREFLAGYTDIDVACCLQFSPDGKHLAAGSIGCSIKVWDLNQENEVKDLQGHSDSVNCVCYSQDGKYLASCSSDRAIKLWNLFQGRVVKRMERHSERVNSVCFSPDGRLLASASHDSTVRLFDIFLGREIKQIVLLKSAHKSSSAQALATMSPNGTASDIQTRRNKANVVSGGSGGSSGAIIIKKNPVYCVAFSPDGRYLSSGQGDGSTRLWEVANGFEQPSRNLRSRHLDCIVTLAFSPNSKLLAVAGGRISRNIEEHPIVLWKFEEGIVLRRLLGHTNRVLSVCFSPCSASLVSGGLDKSVRVWNVENGKEINQRSNCRNSVYSVCYSPDGRSIAFACQNRVIIWNLQVYLHTEDLLGHTDTVLSVAYSPDGSQLTTAGRDMQIMIYQKEEDNDTALKSKFSALQECRISCNNKQWLLCRNFARPQFFKGNKDNFDIQFRSPMQRRNTKSKAVFFVC